MKKTNNRFMVFDEYGLQYLPQHLIKASRTQKLQEFLLGFDWLEAKTNRNFVAELLDDYDQILNMAASNVSKRHSLETLQKAIRLSENVIVNQPKELGMQLISKLLAMDDPQLLHLVDEIKHKVPRPRLIPTWPSLTHPRGPLLRTYRRDTDGHGNDIAITPDGKYMAVIYGDSTIYCYVVVWQLDSRVPICSIKSGFLFRVGLREDGKFVAAYGDGKLRTWDVPSGELLRSIEIAPRDEITSTAISSNAEIALFGHTNGNVIVWDIASGTTRYSLQGHRSRVMCVSISPDGLYAATASSARKDPVKIWELQSGRLVRKLPIVVPSMIAIGPRGEILVTSDLDHALHVWSIPKRKRMLSLEGHAETITSIDISTDGRYVVSGSHDRMIKIWDLQDGKLLNTLRGHVGSVDDAVFSNDCQYVYSIAMDGDLNKWKVKNGDNEYEYSHYRGHDAGITSLDMLDDGSIGISGGNDGSVKLWDLERGALLHLLEPHNKSITAVAISKSGIALSASEDLSLKVWQIATGELLHELTSVRIDEMAITPDGRTAITIGSFHMDIWDLETGRSIQEYHFWDYTKGSMSIQDIHFNEMSRSYILAFDTFHRGVSIWRLDLQTEKFSCISQVRVSKKPQSATVSSTSDLINVAIWPCGTKAVVAGGGEDPIRVFDFQLQKTLYRLKERSGWSFRVNLDPQGDLVVGAQNEIVIWEASTGKFLTSFTGAAFFVEAKMASNGRIFARDTQNVLHLFHYDP